MVSIVNVAMCVSIAYFLNFFLTYFVMVKFCFNEFFVYFLKTFWHEIVFFAVMMGVTLFPIEGDNMVISFLLKTTVITVTYVIMLYITGLHKLLFNLVRNR